MNSALECMRSIKELTNYFLNNCDESQLNLNNIIGTGGFLTLTYVMIMKMIKIVLFQIILKLQLDQ